MREAFTFLYRVLGLLVVLGSIAPAVSASVFGIGSFISKAIVGNSDLGIDVDRFYKSVVDQRAEFRNMISLKQCAWNNYQEFGSVLDDQELAEPNEIPAEVHWFIFSTQVNGLQKYHQDIEPFYDSLVMAKDAGVELMKHGDDVDLNIDFNRLERVTDEVIRSAVARHDRIIEASHRAGDRNSDLRLFNALKQCKKSHGY